MRGNKNGEASPTLPPLTLTLTLPLTLTLTLPLPLTLSLTLTLRPPRGRRNAGAHALRAGVSQGTYDRHDPSAGGSAAPAKVKSKRMRPLASHSHASKTMSYCIMTFGVEPQRSLAAPGVVLGKVCFSSLTLL